MAWLYDSAVPNHGTHGYYLVLCSCNSEPQALASVVMYNAPCALRSSYACVCNLDGFCLPAALEIGHFAAFPAHSNQLAHSRPVDAYWC
jgi:hypothetical protein